MWADHRLPRNLKIRLYQTSVCSSFTHACEAWNITDSVRKMINGFNSRCLSRITGKDLRDTASDPEFDLVAAVVKRRLRFAGHILRMNPERLLRRTFLSYMNGSNTRPDGSLLHGYESMTIEQVTSLAQKRSAWSRFVDSLNLWHLGYWCRIAPHRCNTSCIMQYIHLFVSCVIFVDT